MHRFTIAPENFVKQLVFPFLSAQYYCLIAKSLWKQDFWNVRTFIQFFKVLHTKSTKKGRRRPNRNIPVASNSPSSCRKFSQELPWELVVPVRRRRCDIEFMCLFDGFNGVLQVRAWGKRWWYRSSRRYFTVTSFPSNQEPCNALKAFPAYSGERHLTYTQPSREFLSTAIWTIDRKSVV